MKINYMKRYAMLLGAAALATSGLMAEEAVWQNINYKMKAPSFVTGWSGNFTQIAEGVAENYNGAFEAYQVLPDMPAGDYVLTVNAFYRYANNDLSAANMKDGANHNAYIFLGTATTPVEGLFDNTDAAPGSMADANAAFLDGKYLNTVKYTHTGGDLRLGIANTGGLVDEWTCFDNFKLTGPEGDVAIPNGDFADTTLATDNGWDFLNKDGSAKLPDIPLCTVQTKPEKQEEYNGKVPGVHRKSNASEYNYGTPVELEAGTYRFGVQSFFRVAPGNESGFGWDVKGQATKMEGIKSGYDCHVENLEDPATTAYVFASWGSEEKPWNAANAAEDKLEFHSTPIKSIFDEKFETYPENEPTSAEEGCVDNWGHGWCDSGFEHQSARTFVNNPDLYRNYVEFTLAEPATVWVGMGIDARPVVDGGKTKYWNPARDFTLERLVSTSAVGAIEMEAEAPVEYYNLQGVRVANPQGIVIVKKGNKAVKAVIK